METPFVRVVGDEVYPALRSTGKFPRPRTRFMARGYATAAKTIEPNVRERILTKGDKRGQQPQVVIFRIPPLDPDDPLTKGCCPFPHTSRPLV